MLPFFVNDRVVRNAIRNRNVTSYLSDRRCTIFVVYIKWAPLNDVQLNNDFLTIYCFTEVDVYP